MTHPLDGPRLKVWRAESELKAYRRIEDSFLEIADYKIVRAEINPQTGNQVYRAHIPIPPPIGFGIFVGEIVHNLRSALDQLTWQLWGLNPHAPAAGRTPQFPIYSHRRKVGREPGFETDGRRRIEHLLPQHQAMIERLQPYHRGNGGNRNALYRLSEINNADKHRLIQVMGFRLGTISVNRITTIAPARPLSFRLRRIVMKHGTKVGEAPSDVTVRRDFFPLIAFGEGCLAVKHLAVHLTLRLILEEVTKTVECFAPEF